MSPMAAAAAAAAMSVFLILTTTTSAAANSPTPYLSPTTLFRSYEKMVTTLKIFIYNPTRPFNYPTPPSSLFYTTLLTSPFITQNPDEAHLFLLPFSPGTPTRSIARVVKEIRNTHPYWNRTLGADHFFISPAGIEFSSDRNVVELKKNAVQITTFPTTSGNFIPHKDITLPPLNPSPNHAPPLSNKSALFLGYLRWRGDEQHEDSEIVNELKKDADFVVGSDHHHLMGSSKFCLFVYRGDVAWLAESMAWGCVPVVIVDRWIQDLPMMDVLRWSDMVLVVGTRGGARGLKDVLVGVSEEKYGRMKRLCVEGSRHLLWNAKPQPLDAFHSLIYQLWLRRHTVRYARKEESI